jgi:hypothetical protein
LLENVAQKIHLRIVTRIDPEVRTDMKSEF